VHRQLLDLNRRRLPFGIGGRTVGELDDHLLARLAPAVLDDDVGEILKRGARAGPGRSARLQFYMIPQDPNRVAFPEIISGGSQLIRAGQKPVKLV
jgi:hypothetical protein